MAEAEAGRHPPLAMFGNGVGVLLDRLANTLGRKVDDLVCDTTVGDGGHDASNEGCQYVSHLPPAQATVGDHICRRERP